MSAEAGPAPKYLQTAPSARAAAERAALEARFQAWLREPVRLIIDRNGTIRNAAARPIGWWGVDGPRTLHDRR